MTWKTWLIIATVILVGFIGYKVTVHYNPGMAEKTATEKRAYWPY